MALASLILGSVPLVIGILLLLLGMVAAVLFGAALIPFLSS